MTKTLSSVPVKTLGRQEVMAQRRKTTVSHLFREAVEKTYGIDAGIRSEFDWKEDPLVKFIESVVAEYWDSIRTSPAAEFLCSRVDDASRENQIDIIPLWLSKREKSSS